MTEPTPADTMPKAVRFATITRLSGINISLNNIEKKLEKLDVRVCLKAIKGGY